MNRVTLIPKKFAKTLIPKSIGSNSLCYYLSDDTAHLVYLQNKLGDKIEIKTLSGLFNETFQEIKGAFLHLISELNRKDDSLEWWGANFASGSTSASRLHLNTTYLFCAKKILSDSDKDLIFIVDSSALADCISNVAKKDEYQVVTKRIRLNEYMTIIKRWLIYGVSIFSFLLERLQSRRAVLALFKPDKAKKTHAKKRVVIRSWVTIDKSGKLKDRNFGPLPEWLRANNYEVWILPMFYNCHESIDKIYALAKKQELSFLIPDQYLKVSDYFRALYNDYKLLKKHVSNIEIKKIDIRPIFIEILKEQPFQRELLNLNLCYAMLKRLKELGFEIDYFYYPFENNTPEKSFILGCRTFFPDSKIVGFQHTTFFPNQLAYHLAPGEKDHHPLPDKIIYSGPIYVKLHEKAGFPREILYSGPNLRFESVYVHNSSSKDNLCNEKKVLMLPLAFTSSHNLAFELFLKVKEALKNTQGYRVYIRTHPLLSRRTLTRFLFSIGMRDYKFADGGIIQDWLPKSYAVISTGFSITVMESVVMGTPVIRVIPDNTFYYDPFMSPDYPLKPVNTASEIKEQLQLIGTLLDGDRETFHKIAKQALSEYFTKPTKEKMKVFL